MLKMRLQRIGRRNDPSYRVVVVDVRQGPKSGKYVDLIGTYHPKTKAMNIDGKKVAEWLGKGVQVSPTVNNMLVGQGIIKGKKVNVLPKKSPVVKEKEAETATQPEAESADVVAEGDEEKTPAEDAGEKSAEAAEAAEVKEEKEEEKEPEVAKDTESTDEEKKTAETVA